MVPCPRDDLRKALAQSIRGDELIDLLALESEVLNLCAQRARLYNTIIEEDQNLQHRNQEITSADNNPPARKEGEWFIGTDSIGGTTDTGKIPAPPPLDSVSTAPLAGGAEIKSPARGAARASGADYNWYTMYGSGTDLTVGISDGRGTWLLKHGDILPGGWKIVTIEAKPEKVIISRGKRLFPLPYINRKSASIEVGSRPSAGDIN